MPNFIAIVNIQYGGRKPYVDRRDIRFESGGDSYSERRMALAEKTQAIIEASRRPVRKVSIERVFEVRELKGF